QRGKVARRLVRELRPHRRTVGEAFLFIFIGALTAAAGPWLVGRAIDVDIAHHDGAGLALRMLMLLGVYAVGTAARRAQGRRVGATGQHVMTSLRERLFDQLQALPLAYFDKRPIGDVMSRLSSDVDTLNQLFAQGLTQLLGTLLGLVAILAAMLALHVRLAL